MGSLCSGSVVFASPCTPTITGPCTSKREVATFDAARLDGRQIEPWRAAIRGLARCRSVAPGRRPRSAAICRSRCRRTSGIRLCTIFDRGSSSGQWVDHIRLAVPRKSIMRSLPKVYSLVAAQDDGAPPITPGARSPPRVILDVVHEIGVYLLEAPVRPA